MKKFLLLAALALAGCAHANPPVDLSPPAAPPPRAYHSPHRVAPPHPVARPVVPLPRPRVHVVPVHPVPPTVAPLTPQAPFDDRWSPVIRDVAPVVVTAAPTAEETLAKRWHAVELFLGACAAMLVTSIILGHRKPQG
jgi:hypothetical protein